MALRGMRSMFRRELCSAVWLLLVAKSLHRIMKALRAPACDLGFCALKIAGTMGLHPVGPTFLTLLSDVSYLISQRSNARY